MKNIPENPLVTRVVKIAKKITNQKNGFKNFSITMLLIIFSTNILINCCSQTVVGEITKDSYSEDWYKKIEKIREIEKDKFDQNLIKDQTNNNEIKDSIQSDSKILYRTFNWMFKSKSYSVTIPLHKDTIVACGPTNKILKRKFTPKDLEKFCDTLMITPGNSIVKNLAQQINSIGLENGLFAHDDRIELILSFIQSIPYDKELFEKIKRKEKFKYACPYEVLYKNKGVCLGKTLLGIQMLKELTNVCMFYYPKLIGSNYNYGHVAIGIKCNVGRTIHTLKVGVNGYVNHYKYGESTANVKLGIIPKMINGIIIDGQSIPDYQQTFGKCILLVPRKQEILL